MKVPNAETISPCFSRYCYKRLKVVGIKVLDLDEIENIDEAAKEILLLCGLRSEYIISYYDSIIDNTSLWIVMEYAAAGSVRDLVRIFTVHEL